MIKRACDARCNKFFLIIGGDENRDSGIGAWHNAAVVPTFNQVASVRLYREVNCAVSTVTNRARMFGSGVRGPGAARTLVDFDLEH